MSDQPSFELGHDDTGDNQSDHKPFPSGAELRATVCRAAWDAAVALKPIEDAWYAPRPSDSGSFNGMFGGFARLPLTNGEALQRMATGSQITNSAEGVSQRYVRLTRSWSADSTATITDRVAAVQADQTYDFAGPTDCDSVRTSVWVIFDPDYSIDALNDFFEVLQAHGANFELELEKTKSFTVEQVRKPSGEEMLHLGIARLQPDVNWQRHAITKPWPGFMASAEQVVDHAGITHSEPFDAGCI